MFRSDTSQAIGPWWISLFEKKLKRIMQAPLYDLVLVTVWGYINASDGGYQAESLI